MTVMLVDEQTSEYRFLLRRREQKEASLGFSPAKACRSCIWCGLREKFQAVVLKALVRPLEETAFLTYLTRDQVGCCYKGGSSYYRAALSSNVDAGFYHVATSSKFSSRTCSWGWQALDQGKRRTATTLPTKRCVRGW